ncbi:MAG TPA: MCE family protein [Hellea balneolensis]|uniref:MCE family protein n=1 Tax=Hellea balneolensis TaxID=287478 RepID=A0A7C5R7K2_9PROT|nr:MCE family protein [Hellea balneolensis]
MESKANYALIGTFVLIALFGIVAFVAYISGKQFDEQYKEYMVVYHSPPRGISVGSEVRFNGLKMGEVTSTDLDPNDPNTVLVRIRVKASTPVMVDTYGQNEPLGLTGLSYIQLFAGESTEPLMPKSPKDVPHIEGRGSQIDYLLGGSESVIENVNIALSRAVSVMNDDAIEDFHGILANINKITGAVAESDLSDERIKMFMAAIEQAAIDVSEAATGVDKAAKDVSVFLNREEIASILKQSEITLHQAEQTLKDYSELAHKGGQLSDETMRAIEQLSSTGLTDLSDSMAELKRLIATLNQVSQELERNPRGFIAGREREKMELPQ